MYNRFIKNIKIEFNIWQILKNVNNESKSQYGFSADLDQWTELISIGSEQLLQMVGHNLFSENGTVCVMAATVNHSINNSNHRKYQGKKKLMSNIDHK